MSQMLHPGPEAVSEGEGQFSFGKGTRAWEAKAGSMPEVIMETGSSLLQRKRGWGGPRSELTHTSCMQLCKGHGDPSVCGISVFPVTSIPLGSLGCQDVNGIQW